MDIVIKEFDLEDFRLTTEKLVKQLHETLGDSYTADEFRTYVFKELEGMRDPIRRGEIAWDLIESLNDSENFDRALLIDLCNQITETQSPVYGNAIHLKTMLEFTDETKEKSIDIVEVYKQPITTLLKHTALTGKTNTDLDQLVKGFMNNNVPSLDIPEEFIGLTLSEESMLTLLNFIRLQQIQLQQLQ